MVFRLSLVVAFAFCSMSLPVVSADLKGCFAASYDKAHLQKYPGQTPTMLGVLVTHEDGNILFSVTAKLRGKQGTWGEAGGCVADGGALKCAVDCDGGGFALTPAGDAVTLTNSQGFRLTQTSCDGEAELQMVEPVPGNRLFKLRRAETKVCE